MTREETKELLPIMQAFADGKTIQYETRDGWIDLDALYPHSDILSKYRIKPEPKYRPFKTQEECWQEMLKHQPFGWVKSKKSGSFCCIGEVSWSEAFGEPTITFSTTESLSRCSDSVYKDFTFADGTPFGIKKEE